MSDLQPPRRDDLRRELLTLASEDARVRAELAADGSLFEGYHPRMEEVHRQNGVRLAAVLDEIGWPGQSAVGSEAAQAAWLIVQHAIGDPDLQRRCLRLLQNAAAQGEAPARQAAMLEDRIRTFEGRPQLYGTQLEPNDEGVLRPCPIEEPERVDERRRTVGLPPLESQPDPTKRVPMPADRARFDREYQAWLRRVGWRP